MAGWWLAGLRGRRAGWHLRRWHLLLAGLLGAKLLHGVLSALHSLVFNRAERQEKLRLKQVMRLANTYRWVAALWKCRMQLNLPVWRVGAACCVGAPCQPACLPALPQVLQLHPSCALLRMICSLPPAASGQRQPFSWIEWRPRAARHPRQRRCAPAGKLLCCVVLYRLPATGALCPAPGPATSTHPMLPAAARSAAPGSGAGATRVQARSWQQLAQRAAVLADLRERGDLFGLLFALRVDYQRHAGKTTSRWAAAVGAGRQVAVTSPSFAAARWRAGTTFRTSLPACLPACLQLAGGGGRALPRGAGASAALH